MNDYLRCKKIGDKFYKINTIDEDETYEIFLRTFIDNLTNNKCISYTFDNLSITRTELSYLRSWVEGVTADTLFESKIIEYTFLKNKLLSFFEKVYLSSDIWKEHNVGICLADLGTLENIIVNKNNDLCLIDIEDFFTVKSYVQWTAYWQTLKQCFNDEIEYYYLFSQLKGHHVRVQDEIPTYCDVEKEY